MNKLSISLLLNFATGAHSTAPSMTSLLSIISGYVYQQHMYNQLMYRQHICTNMYEQNVYEQHICTKVYEHIIYGQTEDVNRTCE